MPGADTATGMVLPSPLQPVETPETRERGIRLYIKREDLLHPLFGGNKWRKLKYNLDAAREGGHSTLLTYGGARSNHIHATAAAGRAFGFETIGIIRGEQQLPLNPTLSFAAEAGMQLHYMNREDWRQKDTPAAVDAIMQRFHGVWRIPEGGSNALALPGCAELAVELEQQLDSIDHICLACGTGGTLAGLVSGLQRPVAVTGFSVLKDGGSVARFTEQLLRGQSIADGVDWQVNGEFHFGGYARMTDELRRFMVSFLDEYDIELDRVYTSKLLFGLLAMIRRGDIADGATVVGIHSGGLQGNTEVRAASD